MSQDQLDYLNELTQSPPISGLVQSLCDAIEELRGGSDMNAPPARAISLVLLWAFGIAPYPQGASTVVTTIRDALFIALAPGPVDRENAPLFELSTAWAVQQSDIQTAAATAVLADEFESNKLAVTDWVNVRLPDGVAPMGGETEWSDVVDPDQYGTVGVALAAMGMVVALSST